METTLQLTNDEKNILEGVYGKQTSGYNPHRLEAIKNLSAQEKTFFEGRTFLSPHFFVHTLYKVRGSVSPVKFNFVVSKIFDDNENLRANFCDVGTRTVKVIRSSEQVKPEVIFRNLTDSADLDDDFRKIFEADSRRDLDLRLDPLIRFAVYKTSENEFAVLVTLAQLIAESFDAENFFAQISGAPAESNSTKVPEKLPPKNQEAIRDYWAKILDNPPPISKLPNEQESSGAYSQKIFRTSIPAELVSELNERSQGNRMMLTAILQSAWGFMLQLTNQRRDCLFCEVFSSGSENDFTFNVIPVRMTCDDDSTVEQILRAQFRQMIISKPYSLNDWTILNDLTGQRKLFDHCLRWVDVPPQGMNYIATPAEPHGKLMFRGAWDSQGMKLGAYFYYFKENLVLSFLYDEKTFSEHGIEQLCELYKTILRHILDDWIASYSEFLERIGSRREADEKPEEISAEERRRKLRNFIGQLPILQGRHEGTIDLFVGKSQMFTLYEGDRISSKTLDKNFVFVADGILSRNADTGDGWYNTLDIIEKNTFVNPTYLLEERPFKLSATVLSDKAELLAIPHDFFVDILRRNVEVTFSVMSYALEQMGRYQALWLLSSDYRTPR
ncbi:MAG: hypothetical protein IKE46_04190 [Selenomonadaceae bacterium]|nr:hypothetical protein [Selenomonadaceae bacterium]